MSKWSDFSGIKKLTSIPFWTSEARKLNKEEHENRSLQSQILQSANIDLRPFWLQYLELQKSNWCKINFVRFLTQITINAPNASQKQCHMREIWFFKYDNWILPTNRFREETSPNYVLKHLNRHPSLYFNNLAPLSQSLKIHERLFLLFYKNSYWST
jgi:hypothetical protein